MKNLILLIVSLIIVTKGFSQIADSSKREVKLQGAINFRDLGGYETKDGKHIKWGKLYRSAELSHLTQADLDKLQQLSLAYIADFRGPYEVTSAPDKIPYGATRVSLPAGSENTGDSNYMKTMLQSIKPGSALVPFYSNIDSFGDRYRPLFEALLEVNKDSAVLFHCSAGKDRTGIAAALLLYTLGVDKQIIVDDYLASNYYRRNENDKAARGMAQLYKMDERVAREILSVQENYLMATYNAIRSQYGSMDIFLEKVLALSDAKIQTLKTKFLE